MPPDVAIRSTALWVLVHSALEMIFYAFDFRWPVFIFFPVRCRPVGWHQHHGSHSGYGAITHSIIDNTFGDAAREYVFLPRGQKFPNIVNVFFVAWNNELRPQPVQRRFELISELLILPIGRLPSQGERIRFHGDAVPHRKQVQIALFEFGHVAHVVDLAEVCPISSNPDLGATQCEEVRLLLLIACARPRQRWHQFDLLQLRADALRRSIVSHDFLQNFIRDILKLFCEKDLERLLFFVAELVHDELRVVRKLLFCSR